MRKSKLIAGIDIGSSKITTLIAQYDEEEERVSITGVGVSPARGVRKGQIVDIEEAAESVVASVEQAERMAGYGLSHVFATIGGAHITSRNSSGVVAVADPSGEINDSDIERVIDAASAVSLPEAREILHVIPKEYKVDGETQVKDPNGMTGVRLEVETHLITGSSTAIKNIEKTIGEVGLTIDEMVFVGLASAESVLSETEKELGVVLVDIGGGTTSIEVFIEGAIAYSGVLPIGGKNVTNDIAAGLRVSLDAAEQLKCGLKKYWSRLQKRESEKVEIDMRAMGISEGERKVSGKTLIDGIIKPRLNEIFTMVGEQLANADVAGKTPSGIVVTGGGALCVGIEESAKRMLSMPVRIGKPVGVSGLVDEVNSPSFAAGVGLLLYGAREEKPAQNLWTPSGFVSKVSSISHDLQVRGLVDKITEIFKKLLP